MTKQPDALRYEFEGGKYIAFVGQGTCTVTRHGELWRDLTGDKFVGSMFSEIDRLHEVNVELLAEFKEIISDYEFCDKEAGYGPRAFAYYETAKRVVAKATGETE